jgi:4-diphosphocytidyl-2-C-methyl-D-erythritol kinase
VSRPAARRGARVEAGAKLNLFLRVHEREPSGYHRLETLFQRIALADTVTVHTGMADRTLACDHPDVGPVEENLAWRAATAFASTARWPEGFAIEVEKRIPVGGGLAGGSADAAAVLRALNALAPRPLDHHSLASIAFALGADVPYLLSDLPVALGGGRGERLLALAPLPARRVILLVPPFGVSSRDAFAWLAAARSRAPQLARPALPVPSRLTWPAVAGYAANELEPAVFARHPELATLRDALEHAGALFARMSGSGSTLFGVFEAPERSRANLDLPLGIDLGAFGAKALETATVERVPGVELL